MVRRDWAGDWVFAAAVGTWGEACEFPEVLAEEERVGVADLGGDFLDGVGGFGKAAFGVADAFAAEPVDGACAEGGFEEAGEVRGAEGGASGEVADAVLLEVEEFHVLDGAGEDWGDGWFVGEALASGDGEGEEAGDGGVDEGGGVWGAALHEGEDFEVEGRGGGGVESDKDGGVGDAEEIGEAGEARAFGADPEDFPWICVVGAMFVRVVAIDPDPLASGDLVGAAGDPEPAFAAEAEDPFVAREVIAPDVVVGACDEVAGAGDGVEDVLVGFARGGEEGDWEVGCGGGAAHDWIIQLIRQEGPFQIGGSGVERRDEPSAAAGDAGMFCRERVGGSCAVQSGGAADTV